MSPNCLRNESPRRIASARIASAQTHLGMDLFGCEHAVKPTENIACWLGMARARNLSSHSVLYPWQHYNRFNECRRIAFATNRLGESPRHESPRHRRTSAWTCSGVNTLLNQRKTLLAGLAWRAQEIYLHILSCILGNITIASTNVAELPSQRIASANRLGTNRLGTDAPRHGPVRV